MPAYVEAADKDECLSEGGGNHVSLVTTDATVATLTSGDIVVYYELIGVALTDYDATKTRITLDLTGGHMLEVVAVDNLGNSAVVFGDWLYYDRAKSQIDKDRTAGPPMGQALGTVAAGETETICVVLRPVPPEYA